MFLAVDVAACSRARVLSRVIISVDRALYKNLSANDSLDQLLRRFEVRELLRPSDLGSEVLGRVIEDLPSHFPGVAFFRNVFGPVAGFFEG